MRQVESWSQLEAYRGDRKDARQVVLSSAARPEGYRRASTRIVFLLRPLPLGVLSWGPLRSSTTAPLEDLSSTIADTAFTYQTRTTAPAPMPKLGRARACTEGCTAAPNISFHTLLLKRQNEKKKMDFETCLVSLGD